LNPEPQDELLLVAFRYAAGDMPAEEAQAFELRLADDQAARDALCQAVALGERLAEAGPVVAPSAEPVVTRKSAAWILQPLGWMAVGAAAAVLIASLIPVPSGLGGRRGQRVTQPESPRSEPAVDALVWARLQSSDQQTTDELERWLDESDLVVVEDGEDFADPAEMPSWVFATRGRNEDQEKP
jgi:hypothetical protein